MIASIIPALILVADDDKVTKLPNIKANYTYFPFTRNGGALTQLAGGIQGVLILVICILFMAAVACWVAGRVGSSQRMQAIGVGSLITAVAGIVFISSVWGMAGWATGIKVFDVKAATTQSSNP